MKGSDTALEEYKIIRAEILNCVNLHNTLATFTVTAVTALLAFALAYQQPYLFLMPFAVIIPMQGRIFHYRQNILKLSAYDIVFLEPLFEKIRWETRHKEYSDITNQYKYNHFRNFDCFFLSVISYATYLIAYLPPIWEITWQVVLIAGFPLIFVFYVGQIAVRTNRVLTTRKQFIAMWQEVKEKEDAAAASKPSLEWEEVEYAEDKIASN